MAKTLSYNNLIREVAKSSKYHIYEVEDVLVHLTKVLQEQLAKGNNVRLTGVGKLKVQQLKIQKTNAQGEKKCYNSFRLSVVSDASIKEYLKEKYAEPNTD